LRDDETMFVWCDEVQLYWLANKRPPATGVWKKHMTDGPMRIWLAQRTLEQLRAHPPDLIVTWTAEPEQLDGAMSEWISQHYAPLPGNANRLPIALHARNGSDLAARTRATLP
jgi:hypothetical protein